ncbi:MAG: 1,2-phenylacetyl-CoA epoxidase subunit PaaC [Candidatus Kapaibacterium sp.]
MSNNGNPERQALFSYVLRHADDRLILGHRLSEWCGHGPILEEDIATTNIALDILGQAVALLEYASELDPNNRSADELAYTRNDLQFTNLLLCEQPNGDFAGTILRQFFFDAYSYYLFDELKNSADEKLAAIAARSHKEVIYHLRHSSKWVLRLGDGTEESHGRIASALDELLRFTGQMFEMDKTDEILLNKGIAVNLNHLKGKWRETVDRILNEATLGVPDYGIHMPSGSRMGRHSEYLGYILSQMQFLNRAYPGAEW